MYHNYSTKLKLVIIALTLISSISFSLSLNALPTPQIINKLAFAQQNPVLPNYKGNHRAIEPSSMVNNKANSASSEVQLNSLVHYQPITPASHDYTGNSDQASINRIPISTATNMINSTNPAGIVQPVSLVHYQPIVAAGSGDPIISTNSAGLEHTSTNDGGHHSSNDNSHDGGSHSGSTHHKSSSTHDNNDHGGGTKSHHSNHSSHQSNHHSSHHSSHHSGSHHHGASASASAGSGGASASASAG